MSSMCQPTDITPYFNEECKTLSDELCRDSIEGDLDFSLSFENKTTEGSWFSVEHYQHGENALTVPLEFIEQEETVLRTQKIRIYLDAANRQKARRYFGLSRYWYNQSIEYLQQSGTKAYFPEVYRALKEKEHPEWAFDCPSPIRGLAMQDAIKAVKNAKSKYKTANKIQRVSFRSKGDLKQSFATNKNTVRDKQLFSYKSHDIQFKPSQPIPTPDTEGVRMVCERGRYYLIVPVRVPMLRPENQRMGHVALDPGVRTFLTYFSKETHGKIGEGDFTRIFRLCRHLDKLISRASKARCKAKRRMRKAMGRMRSRIIDLVDELHRKAARFLVTNFDTILLPTFETSQMTAKDERKIRSKTARSMLSFAFYRFSQTLESMAEKFGCAVRRVNEAYTSKTCSYCGKIRKATRTIKCCHGKIDRDYNGARGIYLASLAGHRLVS